MSPVTPRPAASLILLRETTDDPEVLLGQRHRAARAFPGAMVFPGGKVEPQDAEAEARSGFAAGVRPAAPGAGHAALRETFEETGLWLCEGVADVAYPSAPGLARLTPYAHWITPTRYPYRFDTWFFLALATMGEARAPLAGDEFERLAWGRPAQILETHANALFPPTRHSLERLAGHGSLADILEEARVSGPFEAGEVEMRWDVSAP